MATTTSAASNASGHNGAPVAAASLLGARVGTAVGAAVGVGEATPGADGEVALTGVVVTGTGAGVGAATVEAGGATALGLLVGAVAAGATGGALRGAVGTTMRRVGAGVGRRAGGPASLARSAASAATCAVAAGFTGTAAAPAAPGDSVRVEGGGATVASVPFCAAALTALVIATPASSIARVDHPMTPLPSVTLLA